MSPRGLSFKQINSIKPHSLSFISDAVVSLYYIIYNYCSHIVAKMYISGKYHLIYLVGIHLVLEDAR